MNCITKYNDVSDRNKGVGTKIVLRNRILCRDLLIVLVLAVSLRTVCSLRSFGDAENRQMQQDSDEYRTLANNLLGGKGFGVVRAVGPQGQELWTPELCRTPGYPMLIAGFEWLTGHGRAATIVFQQISGIVLCLMVMLICQRWFGRKAGLVAGCLLALDLQAIGLSNLLLADSLFCFLLFSSVFLIVKCMEGGNLWLGLGAGLLLGSSILTKPAGIYLPLVVSAVLLIYAYVRRCRRMLPAVIVISVFAYLPVCGWVIRNGIVCGEYTLSSVSRIGLFQRMAALSLAKSEGVSHEVIQQRLAAIAGVPIVRVRYTALSPEENRKVREVAISAIIENRLSFMKEWAIASINVLFGPERLTLLALGLPRITFGFHGDSTDISDVPAASVAILAFETLVLGSTYVMLFMTLWKCIRLRQLPTLVLICLISALCILALSSMPGGGDPRYRSAVIPLLVVIAVACFGLNRKTATSKGRDYVMSTRGQD